MESSLKQILEQAIKKYKIGNHAQFIEILSLYYKQRINQSTLSRKLKKYGIEKKNGYYQKDYSPVVNNNVLDIRLSFPNIIIIYTSPGHAGAIAYTLDKAIHTQDHSSNLNKYTLGTVAGDDTIIVITDGKTNLATVKQLLIDYLTKNDS